MEKQEGDLNNTTHNKLIMMDEQEELRVEWH
jgi:hypothetical protein